MLDALELDDDDVDNIATVKTERMEWKLFLNYVLYAAGNVCGSPARIVSIKFIEEEREKWREEQILKGERDCIRFRGI